MPPKRAKKSTKVENNVITPIEVPQEFLNDVNGTIQFNNCPTWCPPDEICPALDPFPIESEFYGTLQGVLNCFRSQNGVKLSKIQERQLFEKVIETIISGIYDTEEKYIWLISCVARILLQEIRQPPEILLSDVFSRYNCSSLYCPAKLHQISEELYKLTHGNVFSITVLVEKLSHINPVLHYICICIVAAGMSHVHLKVDPEVFKPIKPLDVISMLKMFDFTGESADLEALYEFQKLMSLYHSLVVMNENLGETHAENLVVYLTEKKSSYLKFAKKWLFDAHNYVHKEMLKKKMSPSLLALKQQLFIELGYGLRDHLDELMLNGDQ